MHVHEERFHAPCMQAYSFARPIKNVKRRVRKEQKSLPIPGDRPLASKPRFSISVEQLHCLPFSYSQRLEICLFLATRMVMIALPVIHTVTSLTWMKWISRSLATLVKDKEVMLTTERLASPLHATDQKIKGSRSGKSKSCIRKEIFLALDSSESMSLSKDLFQVQPSLTASPEAKKPMTMMHPVNETKGIRLLPVSSNECDGHGDNDGNGDGSSGGSRGSGNDDEDGPLDAKFSFTETLSDAKPQKVIEHYFELKLKYPAEYLLLFQIGDFYEFYGKDAERAATTLDITLTSKQCLDPAVPDVKNGKVSFTGFQIRSLDYFLERLIKAGCSAVICDQMPLTGITTKIQRRVTRVVTPGTLTEENLLEKGIHNYLLALSFESEKNQLTVGLAWMDLSTGLYVMAECKEEEFRDHYIRLKPREIRRRWKPSAQRAVVR